MNIGIGGYYGDMANVNTGYTNTGCDNAVNTNGMAAEENPYQQALKQTAGINLRGANVDSPI